MNKKNTNFLFLPILSLLIVGMVNCGLSPGLKLDPESKEFYETARLVMTKEENDIFSHLPDQETRREFIEDFWEKRDPDSDTEVNEFKEEFFSRIKYANDRFKEGIPGWKTDRGRIYIYFGPPDKIEREPFLVTMPGVHGYLLWVYYELGLAVEFFDLGNNSYSIDPYSGFHGSLTDAIEQARFGIIQKHEGLPSKFMDFDLDYDKEEKEATVSIPVKGLPFKEEGGLLTADFEFDFFIYHKGSSEKTEFHEERHFEVTEEKLLSMEKASFSFSFPLSPGDYYFDVVIIAKPDLGKTRKFFRIKI
jgi:GWxTD domain-containing protein